MFNIAARTVRHNRDNTDRRRKNKIFLKTLKIVLKNRNIYVSIKMSQGTGQKTKGKDSRKG